MPDDDNAVELVGESTESWLMLASWMVAFDAQLTPGDRQFLKSAGVKVSE